MSTNINFTDEPALLVVEDVRVHYPVAADGWLGRKRVAKSVDGVSLTLARGETLGIVGESGSGKTTIGRAILRRAPLTSGKIVFRGQDVTHVRGEELRQLRRHMQLVFQDPSTSLNPRQTVFESIAEPLLVHGLGRDQAVLQERVTHLIMQVGLPADSAGRYPHAFSGGQRQRIGIARALYRRAEVIVFDEATSALDNDTERAVMDAIENLGDDLTILIIAHRLTTLQRCDQVVELSKGRIIRSGTYADIVGDTIHDI